VRALDEDRTLTADERRGVSLLAASHRSLFELHGLADQEMDVEDVVGGARFRVAERRKTLGFAPRDLFEARVIWDGQTVIFGRTFLFHPPDAREVALGWVEAATQRGLPRQEILFQLARNHVRWHRLGHTGAAKIYRGDS
jgi:hypothetical protein